ncbi:pilus assembly protein PilM [Terrisporobacter sp.]
MQEEKEVKKSKIKDLVKMDLKDIISKINNKSKVKKKKVKDNRNKIISLDIDEDYIKIVEGRYYKNELYIYKCIEVETPINCIYDGKIINSEILAKTLKKALSENKIKAKHVSITTNSTQIINRELIIPKVEDDEIKTVINYEISKYLPINLNDCIVESLIIDEIEVDGVEKLKVYTICYPEKMARLYFDLIQKLNLKPYNLDIKFNSLNKIINYSQIINDKDYYLRGSNVFINIGSVSTDINIYINGKVDFTRIIRQGYDTLEYHEDQLILEPLIEEIERNLQFYKNRIMGTEIEKIYLLGEGSRIENLDIYMWQRFDIEVENIEYIEFINFKNDEYEEEIYKYLNAMGTIIRL